MTLNQLQIIDLKNGNINISWQQGNSVPRLYGPVPFADPLSVKDRDELRWYLEDYLTFPYGAERHRAEQVEAKMEEWGESLFKQVFIKAETDPDPRQFYQEAVREGLDQCELCISSDDQSFLNIPWELMRDPTPGRGYLAPSLAGLYRQRAGQKIEAPFALSPENPFRVLLVIARPYGKRDIPLGTVARPMLEALRPLRPRIELEVLRPPTFDEFQKRLNARKGYYNLVHFDGHGVFAADQSGQASMFGARAEFGHLVFEKEDGTDQIVNSRDLGQALAECKVPIFVLNACQSAQEGKADPFGSVASQLVAIGARGVVAMSYSVYATTASKFIERFYEKLIEHVTLSEAVAEARRRLFVEPDHDSVIGSVELRDWIVPTLYQQEQRYVPVQKESGAQVADQSQESDVFEQAKDRCPEGQFGFIGRDYDVLRIERALRDDKNPWILLSGIGGVGKTELAFGFARWFAETGGALGGVFVASFKEKADFGQVIGSIVGFGTEFSRLNEDQQRQWLTDYLRKNPCLLVWDNFEPVAGYPEGAMPLASDEEQKKLADFLKSLKDGKSRVIITTRKTNEKWLGIAAELVKVGGLAARDAKVLAKQVLKTVGRQPEDFKNDPDYSRLITLLNGHARSIEIVLPQLETKTPKQIIEALQHRVSSLGESMEDASLAFAFSQMGERARRHLPFIGLFASRVDADYVGYFTNIGTESKQSYIEIIGESLDADGWEAVLEEASRNGLIRSIGNRMYELHPTLPAFLRRQLVDEAGEEGLARLDDEFLKFYAGLAASLHEGIRKADRKAVGIVAFEEANLLRALRLAETKTEWLLTSAIVPTLKEFYEISGRIDEWNALRAGLLSLTGREMSADADLSRASLWMFLLGEEANHAMGRGDMDTAESAHKRILDYLLSLNNPNVEPNIAVAYHQLGRIAEERQQFDLAEQWYKKALEIRERLGLERYAADEYHQLGIIAQERQQFDLAEQWYKKALEIYERLGLERDAASDYHQLGNIAYLRQQFDLAEQWYKKALEIRERLGLERYAASDYHQLGRIAQERQQFDLAEQWYKKALEIYERLGLERDAASDYHQLGIIAQERQQFDLAEQWYKKALEIYERLGHPPSMINTLAQFGVLRRKQNRFQEAVAWFLKALVIAANYQMRVGGQILRDLAITMKAMGEAEFVEAWRHAAPQTEPPLEMLREIVKQIEGE